MQYAKYSSSCIINLPGLFGYLLSDILTVYANFRIEIHSYLLISFDSV
jgi:hypothetical protein